MKPASTCLLWLLVTALALGMLPACSRPGQPSPPPARPEQQYEPPALVEIAQEPMLAQHAAGPSSAPSG